MYSRQSGGDNDLEEEGCSRGDNDSSGCERRTADGESTGNVIDASDSNIINGDHNTKKTNQHSDKVHVVVTKITLTGTVIDFKYNCVYERVTYVYLL